MSLNVKIALFIRLTLEFKSTEAGDNSVIRGSSLCTQLASSAIGHICQATGMTLIFLEKAASGKWEHLEMGDFF